MKQKLALKLKMYDRIITVMNTYLSVWNQFSEISRSNDTYVKNFKTLIDLKAEYEKPLDPLIQKRDEIRMQLIDLLKPVIDVISISLIDSHDKKTSKILKTKAEKLNTFNNRKLLKLSGFIIDLTKTDSKKTKMPDFSMYGLKSERIDKIRLLSNELLELEKEVNLTGKNIEKAKKGINKLLSSNDTLLEKRIDKFVRLFQEENRAFFDEYFTARILEKQKKRKASSKKVVSEKMIPV